MPATAISLETVPIEKPDDVNVVVGQAHFIKTVEDLHEALAGVSLHLRFGIAFFEASGARLVRRSGNDADLISLAVRNAQAIGAGHAFVITLREGFPVSVLNQVKAVPRCVRCSVPRPTRSSCWSPPRAPAAVSPELLMACPRSAWRRTPARPRGTAC